MCNGVDRIDAMTDNTRLNKVMLTFTENELDFVVTALNVYEASISMPAPGRREAFDALVNRIHAAFVEFE